MIFDNLVRRASHKWRVEFFGDEKFQVKLLRAYGGCLGAKRRRRTWPAAKSLGELQASDDPGISEWGNPAAGDRGHPRLNP